MDLSRASLDRELPSRLSTIQMNHAAVSPLPARAAGALREYAELLSTRGPLAFPALDARVKSLREASNASRPRHSFKTGYAMPRASLSRARYACS